MHILLLLTSHNSLSQRIALLLRSLSITTTIEYAISEAVMLDAVEVIEREYREGRGERLGLVVCPFLTKKVPKEIYNKYLTLIIHPGPPGDAGPSALDWALSGDLGLSASSSTTLATLFPPSSEEFQPPRQGRGYWGVTCLQAIEALDEGPIWAFEQFQLPDQGTTKSAIYRTGVTNSACLALLSALARISSASSLASLPAGEHPYPPTLLPPPTASTLTTRGIPFLGGQTQHRPLLKPGERAIDPVHMTAERCVQIIRASDSQPGCLVKWLDREGGRKGVFLYGGHVEMGGEGWVGVWEGLGGNTLGEWGEVKAGTIVAQREGGVLVKSPPSSSGGVGFWITHARLPLPKAAPGEGKKLLPVKLGTVDVLMAGGMGAQLVGVPEWSLEAEGKGWGKKEGTWQEIWVEKERIGGPEGGWGVYAYWEFYNGACSTRQCERLLKAIMASVEGEGDEKVRILCLMGGQNYYSNGIHLNVIEASPSPSHESWANINAIDDLVEFILGDSSPLSVIARSPFLLGVPTLAERGILTLSALRGNAGAGGLALATCADIVLAHRTSVFNPAYRSLGLFGSEFHTYHWRERVGPERMREMCWGMREMSAEQAEEWGLVDYVYGDLESTPEEGVEAVKRFVRALGLERNGERREVVGAPWTRSGRGGEEEGGLLGGVMGEMVRNKLENHRGLEFPLVNYRNEELSQMLLDFHDPIRSTRYHSRRLGFVRKLAPTQTPLRFATHRRIDPTTGAIRFDPEEKASFDDAPGHVRGEEWAWEGCLVPKGFMRFDPGLVHTPMGMGKVGGGVEARLVDAFPVPPEHQPERARPTTKSSNGETTSQSQGSGGEVLSRTSTRIAWDDGVVKSEISTKQRDPSQQVTVEVEELPKVGHSFEINRPSSPVAVFMTTLQKSKIIRPKKTSLGMGAKRESEVGVGGGGSMKAVVVPREVVGGNGNGNEPPRSPPRSSSMSASVSPSRPSMASSPPQSSTGPVYGLRGKASQSTMNLPHYKRTTQATPGRPSSIVGNPPSTGGFRASIRRAFTGGSTREKTKPRKESMESVFGATYPINSSSFYIPPQGNGTGAGVGVVAEAMEAERKGSFGGKVNREASIKTPEMGEEAPKILYPCYYDPEGGEGEHAK